MEKNGPKLQSEPKSLYERLKHDLENDGKVQEEVALGRRVGLYRLKKKLGAGNFAQVKLGVHLLTNEKVAVKIIEKAKLDDQSRQLLSTEVACMERLLHPNIIRLFEVIETYPKLHLVMEIAAEGCLMDRLVEVGKFSEGEARDIITQVVSAVGHMHDCGVIHRDLKAENIFFSKNQVKIGDFGFSALATPSQHLDVFCGSPPYAAPELFQEDHYLGPPVDIWAIGILLYYMVSGKLPFSADSIPELKEKILLGEFYMPRSITHACQGLLAGILNKEVEERYTMKDIVGCEWMCVNGGSVVVETLYSTGGILDREVIDKLASLGVPTEDHDQLTGEPRSSAAGAYRIILQGRLNQDTSTQQHQQLPAEEAKKEGEKPKRKQKSKLCIIL